MATTPYTGTFTAHRVSRAVRTTSGAGLCMRKRRLSFVTRTHFTPSRENVKMSRPCTSRNTGARSGLPPHSAWPRPLRGKLPSEVLLSKSA